MVSGHIGGMRILWLAIDDEPGPRSERAFFERNLIALLSSKDGPQDRPSASWLGKHVPALQIQVSGLWNIEHVDRSFEPQFLDALRAATRRTLTTPR